jgi:hypothetical protein
MITTTSHAANKYATVYTIIKDSLMDDFCEALSTQIIYQNCKKFNLNLSNLDRASYRKLVDAIAFDYRAIMPSTNSDIDLKKRRWLDAIE